MDAEPNQTESQLYYLIATESTEEHGKINIKAFIFSCSSVDSVDPDSVDSVAILSTFIRLNQYL